MSKIKSLQAVYETSDGNKFPLEADAKAHQELLDATEEFSRARRRFEAATIDQRRTADGKHFDIHRWDDYYAVVQRHRQEPYIRTVKFWRDTTFRLYELGSSANENLQIVVFDREQKVLADFNINELYAEKENAIAALIVQMEKYLVWMNDDLAKMKAGKWPV